MLSFTSWNPTSHREYRKSSPTTFSKLTSSFFKAVTFRGKNQEKEGTQTSEKVKMPSMVSASQRFFSRLNYRLTTEYQHLPNRPTGVLALFSRKPVGSSIQGTLGLYTYRTFRITLRLCQQSGQNPNLCSQITAETIVRPRQWTRIRLR